LTQPTSPALEPLGERLGMKLFELKTDSNDQVRGFGQVAFGGSLVLCVPSQGIAVSVVVNDLTLERELTKSIIDEVLKRAGLRLVSEI